MSEPIGSPNNIEVLLHCHTNPEPHPREAAGAAREALTRFTLLGAIEPTGDGDLIKQREGSPKTPGELPARFASPAHWPQQPCARCGELYGDHQYNPTPGQCPFVVPAPVLAYLDEQGRVL